MSRLYDGEKDSSLIICSSSIAAGRFKNDDDKRTISANLDMLMNANGANHQRSSNPILKRKSSRNNAGRRKDQ